MNILTLVGNPILTTAGSKIVADALVDGAQAWNNAVMPPVLMLYQNDPALTVDTVLADLVESVFSGYARVALAAMLSAYTIAGVPMVWNSAMADFIAANPLTVPGSAQGYALLKNGGTELVAVERFAAAFPFDEIADQISIDLRLLLPGHLAV
jgi:hypothetical protein